MIKINTRQAETVDDRSIVYALRYDYYVGARELDLGSVDHARRLLCDARDAHALQYGTYAGEDLVGCFRAEIGAPAVLRFGADWAFEDFLTDVPEQVALIGGLCTVPHLRDNRVITHMVRESVAIAKEFDVSHVFFEMCPDLWPLFHEAGLHRKGDALVDRETGLTTAVFQLDCRERVRFPTVNSSWNDVPADDADLNGIADRPRFALVSGGART